MTLTRSPGLIVAIVLAAYASLSSAGNSPKALIAHRGASGDRPEHTAAAYRLAIEQGADFVEPDLAVSKDGVLICLHDDTLERTTNVAQVFPDRYSREMKGRNGEKRWVANDFTVPELKKLDAGRWFNQKFVGARMPT